MEIPYREQPVRAARVHAPSGSPDEARAQQLASDIIQQYRRDGEVSSAARTRQDAQVSLVMIGWAGRLHLAKGTEQPRPKQGPVEPRDDRGTGHGAGSTNVALIQNLWGTLGQRGPKHDIGRTDVGTDQDGRHA